ncbi:MAG: SUMF1/EgtB/PvdO family nonheme iron enzyme [Candidatus Brocadiales bacterium]
MKRWFILIVVTFGLLWMGIALAEQTMEPFLKTKKCPKCNALYIEETIFCGKDGKELVFVKSDLICPECKQKGQPGEDFCKLHGKRLIPASALVEEGEQLPVKKELLIELAKKYIENAKALRKETHFEDAYNEYKKAEKIYPDIAILQYDLCGVCWQLGKKKEAFRHLVKCLKLTPPNTKERDIIEKYISKLEQVELGFTKEEKTQRSEERKAERAKVMKKALVEIKQKCDMTLVPAGTFTMGSSFDEFNEEEKPAHEVYLEAFYIDKYETTNAQYWEFLDYIKRTGDHSKCYKGEPRKKDHTPDKWYENRYYNHPDYPVVRIDWHDAYAYAAWAGRRLPTESEWEKAARGTDGRRFPWGNVWDIKRCNVGTKGSLVVGSYESGKSVYGCYDMSGSMSEWCFDWYYRDYYKESPRSNPKGPEVPTGYRVIRGGSLFVNNVYKLRCAQRRYGEPDERNRSVGFRCATDAK